MILEVSSNHLLLVYDSRCEAPDSRGIAHIGIESVASSCRGLLNLFLDMLTIHSCWLSFSEDQGRAECVIESDGRYEAALARGALPQSKHICCLYFRLSVRDLSDLSCCRGSSIISTSICLCLMCEYICEILSEFH
jgi:hypothetical protein